jgi:hypothetical protein
VFLLDAPQALSSSIRSKLSKNKNFLFAMTRPSGSKYKYIFDKV